MAAANRFRHAISWHQELLSDSAYVQAFIHALGAQGDTDRLYDELSQNADLLVPGFGDIARVGPILKYMDARMVPFLERYSGSGTDAFFEVLCAVALRIEGPEIDRTLAALFYRWTQRFDHKSERAQHTTNNALWHALGQLSAHPRFAHIHDYEARLWFVTRGQIAWYHKHQIVRILEKSPRAYIDIECMLMQTAIFEHYLEDEVDRLDDAADRLFHQLLDDTE